eukprot:CAMPEP_0198144654 /NCGR_PEP_ID=MMETSP1443-20131203/17463_1 /TAXON_ID=186043 /ORGANISM="Entomoneis sp., Strain CCMP2396" /LENGTH=111 /DNA_ID=CAMNT_0043808095 /DNA_START=339 /DNA_END=674 /DNA_ORIENTATION=+
MGFPMGYTDGSNGVKMPAIVGRMKTAHTNAVENLVIFGMVVVVAKYQAYEGLEMAARLFCLTRLAHWPLCVSNVPMGRTVAFLSGWMVLAYTMVQMLANMNAVKALGGQEL